MSDGPTVNGMLVAAVGLPEVDLAVVPGVARIVGVETPDGRCWVEVDGDGSAGDVAEVVEPADTVDTFGALEFAGIATEPADEGELTPAALDKAVDGLATTLPPGVRGALAVAGVDWPEHPEVSTANAVHRPTAADLPVLLVTTQPP